MAVAFDVASAKGSFTTSTTFTHTPTGTPKGVFVMIAEDVGTTDVISAVSYGGAALTRVNRAVDTVGEPGSAYMYFLGSGIPGAAGVGQTVSVTVASGTTAKDAWCVTFTAAGDTVVADNNVIQADAANPTITLASGTGWTASGVSVFYSGANAPTMTSNSQTIPATIGTIDFGTQSACIGVLTTPASGSISLDYQFATDDVAMVAALIREMLVVKTGLGVSPFTGGGASAPIYAETGAGVAPFSGGGASQKVSGSTTYTKQNIGVAPFTGGGGSVPVYAEAGTGLAAFSGGGGNVPLYAETGAAVSPFTGSGASVAIYAETGTGVTPFAGAGASIIVYAETGSGVSPFLGGGGRAIEHMRTGAGVVPFTGGGVEVYVAGASGATYVKAGLGIIGP